VEVEPSPLPLRVVGGHRAGDVEFPARVPQRDQQAAVHPRFVRGEHVQLRAEEVDPEIPVHWDPQEPLVDADEGGRLQNRVGVKLCNSTP
jgi:hypothetical protein